MAERLDPALDHPAYLCGRLLAVYDGLQYAAQGEVNVTVADRCYTLASTHPRLAFPKLANLSRKHLRKLRRDKPGAAFAIDCQIQTLHELLAAKGAKYPSALDLEEQGRFAIGFHHQRAERARAIASKKEADAKGEQQ